MLTGLVGAEGRGQWGSVQVKSLQKVLGIKKLLHGWRVNKKHSFEINGRSFRQGRR